MSELQNIPFRKERTEYIVGPAIKIFDVGVEVVYSDKAPARHREVLDQIYKDDDDYLLEGHIQGFVTSQGRFLDRREAALLVKENMKSICNYDDFIVKDELYSEDLW